MSNDEIILLAESHGFRFHKQKNQFRWSVIAPDEESHTCDQGDPKGMAWLREKLTHFLPAPTPPLTPAEATIVRKALSEYATAKITRAATNPELGGRETGLQAEELAQKFR